MKHFFSVAGLALCTMLSSTDPASAWVNVRFNAGVNWQWQSGGNSLGWGLWQSMPPPMYDGANCPQCLSNPGACAAHSQLAPQPTQAGMQPAAPTTLAAPEYANTTATPTGHPSQQPSAAPAYSNFYGQFFYHQPASFYSDSFPSYRIGVHFGR